MTVAYFTFALDDGTHTGLVRSTEEGEGYTLERVDRAGGWVDDPELMRHFVDPGDSQLVKVDETEARQLASAHGAEL